MPLILDVCLELVLTLVLEFVLDANSMFGIDFERDDPSCD